MVLVGNVTDPDLLRRAGVLAAGHLVAVTDDDGVNAEIAVRVQGVLREARAGRNDAGRRPPLTCTVHLVDPQLYELARTCELHWEGACHCAWSCSTSSSAAPGCFGAGSGRPAAQSARRWSKMDKRPLAPRTWW